MVLLLKDIICMNVTKDEKGLGRLVVQGRRSVFECALLVVEM